ncbi:hypothetical protein SP15_171 [Bacillus phage SP-15]|uniref:Uncharacterized protein n=1 Tax=Bacillus phage SP-15 TaxID=1792032 RepID=A0A127AWA1_9CAUD|nr:hypothetical protein SP15_171 [Bacillus phage SP-15]AMM44969.1 hypothetical protein SP15_171 [Bacillus phage SP-15]
MTRVVETWETNLGKVFEHPTFYFAWDTEIPETFDFHHMKLSSKPSQAQYRGTKILKISSEHLDPDKIHPVSSDQLRWFLGSDIEYSGSIPSELVSEHKRLLNGPDLVLDLSKAYVKVDPSVASDLKCIVIPTGSHKDVIISFWGGVVQSLKVGVGHSYIAYSISERLPAIHTQGYNVLWDEITTPIFLSWLLPTFESKVHTEQFQKILAYAFLENDIKFEPKIKNKIPYALFEEVIDRYLKARI